MLVIATMCVALLSGCGFDHTGAARGDPWYRAFYWVIGSWVWYDGVLLRSIAIVGGLVGLIYAAITGRVLYALLGIILAVFGSLSPYITEAIFGGALLP